MRIYGEGQNVGSCTKEFVDHPPSPRPYPFWNNVWTWVCIAQWVLHTFDRQQQNVTSNDGIILKSARHKSSFLLEPAIRIFSVFFIKLSEPKSWTILGHFLLWPATVVPALKIDRIWFLGPVNSAMLWFEIEAQRNGEVPKSLFVLSKCELYPAINNYFQATTETWSHLVAAPCSGNECVSYLRNVKVLHGARKKKQKNSRCET